MSAENRRPHGKARVGIALATAAASLTVMTGAPPANAALDSSGTWYTVEKTKTCADGKGGYMYAQGNHVSYKKVYWKRNGASHWSNTIWTGHNGGDVLTRILPKDGGNRTARAYLAIAPDDKNGMSPRSQLSWSIICDSRDLIGDNYGDALTRLTQVWRSTYWKMFR